MTKQNKKIEELVKQAEENLEGWKRAKADLINFQKETDRQKTEWIKFANKNIILGILPVVDNFNEALKFAPSEEDSFLIGIKHIQKQLEDLLKEFGVEKMKVLGEKFNPEFHDCVKEEESEEESGVIIKEVQVGYKLNDKILRPPKVVVSK